MYREQRQSLYTENIIITKNGRRKVYNRYSESISYFPCIYFLKFCLMCGKLMKSHKMDKLTCSSNCCQKLNRMIRRGAKPLKNLKNITKPTKQELIKFGFAKKEKKDLPEKEPPKPE